MKKVIFPFFAVLTAVFLSSCGGNDTPQKITQPETYCHTELVYHPLATSVVAVPYRVQDGDKVSEIVEHHKTDPNQVGGPFLDYTEAMFLADNPDVVSTTERSIRKDKCDPTKIDTVWYKKWNLKENDLVYLRIPARIDTIETAGGPNVAWFSPEKTSPVKHIIERTELFFNNIGPKPVTDVNQNLCPNDKLGDVFPQPIREVAPPVYGNPSTGVETPWWVWLIFFGIAALIFLCWFIANQHKKTREAINTHTTTESNSTRGAVKEEGKSTRDSVTSAVNQMTNQQKETNDLLRKVLEQGGLSGNKKTEETPIPPTQEAGSQA